MTDKSDNKTIGSIYLTIILFIVFSLGFFPVIIFGKIVLMFVSFQELWHFFLLPFLIFIGYNSILSDFDLWTCYSLV